MDDVIERINTDETFRDSLLAWLKANGIDGNHVMPQPRPTMIDAPVGPRLLTLRMHVLNAAGKIQVDPANEDEILTQYVTVPVAVEPNADVLAWLTPPCPSCGR